MFSGDPLTLPVRFATAAHRLHFPLLTTQPFKLSVRGILPGMKAALGLNVNLYMSLCVQGLYTHF